MKFTFILLVVFTMNIVQLFAQDEDVKLYTIDYNMNVYSATKDTYRTSLIPCIRYEIYENKVVTTNFSDTAKTIITSTKDYYPSKLKDTVITEIATIENSLDKYIDVEKPIYHIKLPSETWGSFIELSDTDIDFVFNQTTKCDPTKRTSASINFLPDVFIKKHKKLPQTVALQSKFEDYPFTDIQVYIILELESFTDHR